MKGIAWLVGMVDGLAGPGSFERALDWAGESVDRGYDLAEGRSGHLIPRGASSQALALHSMAAPRVRFCLRRVCRVAAGEYCKILHHWRTQE